MDIEAASQKFTSFVTPQMGSKFRKIPFGLFNSQGVFQRFINTLFQNLVGTVIYIDDLIIPARKEDENLLKLRKILN